MFSRAGIIGCALVFFSIISCTEIIDVDLRDGSGEVVITAVTDNYFGTAVFVQKTVAFYDGDIESELSSRTLEVTSVSIMDRADGNEKIPLTKTKSSIYHRERIVYASSFKAKAGHTYTVEVVFEGKTYRATAKMPSEKVAVSVTSDGGEYGWKKSELSSFLGENRYDLKYKVKIPSTQLYAGVSILSSGLLSDKKGKVILIEGPSFSISSLELMAPNTLQSSAFEGGRDFNALELYEKKEGGDDYDDKVIQNTRLCVLTLEYEAYQYLSILEHLNAGSGGEAPNKNPANPVSNWSYGALGYFYTRHIQAYLLPATPK